MSDIHQYQVDLKWNTDRKGTISSPILPNQIEVATPPEFPKGVAGIWSPEHLFIASANSCLMTTFLAIAENSKIEFISFECSAVGTLDKVDSKYAITEITLKPKLVIPNTQNIDKAKRILEMSEKACLISNSIKSILILEPEIIQESF